MLFDVIADCAPYPALYGNQHRLGALLDALHRSGHAVRRLSVYTSKPSAATERWAEQFGVEYRWRERRWRRPIRSSEDVVRAAARTKAEDLVGDQDVGLLVFNEDLYQVCRTAGLSADRFAGVWVDAGDLKSEIVRTRNDHEYWRRFEIELTESQEVVSTSTAADAELFGGVLVRNPLPPVSAVKTTSTQRGAPHLLFVGLLEHGPNAEALSRFCEFMRVALGTGEVSLSVVGTPRIALAESRGLAHTLGRPAELTAAYLGADVAVAPLVSGTGTSLKVIEALGHGVPVVSSEVGARGLPAPVPGMITIGTWDEPDWLEAVDRLCRVTPSERADMHRHVVEHFGPSDTTKSVAEVVGRIRRQRNDL